MENLYAKYCKSRISTVSTKHHVNQDGAEKVMRFEVQKGHNAQKSANKSNGRIGIYRVVR